MKIWVEVETGRWRRIIRIDGNFLGRKEKKRSREARGEVISTRAPELVIVTIPDLEMRPLVRSKLKVLPLTDVIVSLATYLLVLY